MILSRKFGARQPSGLGGEVQGAVLVAHGAGGDADRAVVQRADQRVGLDRQRRLGQLLREAPQLAPAGDRRMVVQEHLMGVAADLALVAHRDHLAALGVVAEAGRIRHADELVVHHRLDDLQRLRHHPAQRLRVGAVADDEVLAVDEAVGPGREGRAGQRHGEGGLPHGPGIHRRTRRERQPHRHSLDVATRLPILLKIAAARSESRQGGPAPRGRRLEREEGSWIPGPFTIVPTASPARRRMGHPGPRHRSAWTGAAKVDPRYRGIAIRRDPTPHRLHHAPPPPI